MGWYEKNSRDATHPVALKEPNAWGFTTCTAMYWNGARMICMDGTTTTPTARTAAAAGSTSPTTARRADVDAPAHEHRRHLQVDTVARLRSGGRTCQQLLLRARQTPRQAADRVFANPEGWPAPEVVVRGSEKRPWDAGNVNVTEQNASVVRHLGEDFSEGSWRQSEHSHDRAPFFRLADASLYDES